MNDDEIAQLETAIGQICDAARGFGLDFYEMRFEICPAEILYTFGAYGMPTRFSHWSFGKAFHRLKTQYDYNLSRIYELVINSDPCYAFLLEGNTLLQNKLVAAHVLGHCDFFKNNWRFAGTSRKMVGAMAAFANRVRHYEQDFGRARVERTLDAALAIQEHVDPFPSRSGRGPASKPNKPEAGPYDDLWALDNLGKKKPPADQNLEGGADQAKKEGQRDLLRFILERSRALAPWQKDVVSTLREEMLYFRPQMETKIMNEGWASLWHARILRDMDLEPDEALEFAKMHSAVLQPSRTSLNPYHLGFKIFEDLERRFGRQRIFEIRQTDTDVSFIRNYLTKELVEDLDLYLFRKASSNWQVSEKRWEQVRDGIIAQITNCGIPYILAMDDDFDKRGELYLKHSYEGIELDAQYLTRTLPQLFHLWGRPVHLETVEDEQPVVYTFDGTDTVRERS